MFARRCGSSLVLSSVLSSCSCRHELVGSASAGKYAHRCTSATYARLGVPLVLRVPQTRSVLAGVSGISSQCPCGQHTLAPPHGDDYPWPDQLVMSWLPGVLSGLRQPRRLLNCLRSGPDVPATTRVVASVPAAVPAPVPAPRGTTIPARRAASPSYRAGGEAATPSSRHVPEGLAARDRAVRHYALSRCRSQREWRTFDAMAEHLVALPGRWRGRKGVAANVGESCPI